MKKSLLNPVSAGIIIAIVIVFYFSLMFRVVFKKGFIMDDNVVEFKLREPEYKLIFLFADNLDDLEEQVNEYAEKGYRAHGTLIVAHKGEGYVQGMCLDNTSVEFQLQTD